MKISEKLIEIEHKADQLDDVLYNGAFFVLWYGCDCSVNGQEDLDWHIGICDQERSNIQFSDIELAYAEDRKLSGAINELGKKIDQALLDQSFADLPKDNDDDKDLDMENIMHCNNKVLDIDGKKFKLTLTPMEGK
jgi:hypothetical protein